MLDPIIRRITLKQPVFRITEDLQFNDDQSLAKILRSSEFTQRQILSQIQKQIVPSNDAMQYGQEEIKQVLQMLEEQLINSAMFQQQDDTRRPKKMSKQFEIEDENTKKQRVDKNKCRVCKNSTIPMILDLLKQNESQDPNQHVTMKSIRQSIVSKSGQSDQKIPYIAFDYSERIQICKRCRFKFHSECVKSDGSADWICDYCHTRIKELQSANQWDYVNNKQLKHTEKKQDLLERIQKKLQIFKIEHPHSHHTSIHQFLQKYPQYNLNGSISYPIPEFIAGDLLSQKIKPKPYMINSNYVEQILRIQSTIQIINPKLPSPQSVNEEYINKHFYDLIHNYLLIYVEEVFTNMEQYEELMSVENYAFFYLFKSHQHLINKLWPLVYRNLGFLIKVQPLDQQIHILSSLVDGLIDLEKMQNLVKARAEAVLKVSQLKILYQHNQSAYVNLSLYLGLDCKNCCYYYFPHVPSSIFVQNNEGWGQYTLSDLNDLIASLDIRGVNENALSENLQILQSIKLEETTTPIKLPRTPSKLFEIELPEVIEPLTDLLNNLKKFLEKLNYPWLTNQEFEEQDPIKLIKIIIEKLIYVAPKPFKLFKADSQITAMLMIFTESISDYQTCLLAVYVLSSLIKEYISYKNQKIQKKIKKNKKVELPLATRREKRENAGKNSAFEDKKVCPKCNQSITGDSKKCNKCGKLFHLQCIRVQCHGCNKKSN